MKKSYILFIHGTHTKASDFKYIDQYFKRKNYNTYSINHDSYGSVSTCINQIKAEITDFVKNYEPKEINFIAHSKGGIEIVYAIKSLNLAIFKTVHLIAVPHKPVYLADLFLKLPNIVRTTISNIIKICNRQDQKPDFSQLCKDLGTDGLTDMRQQYLEDVMYFTYGTFIKSYRCDLKFLCFFLINNKKGENDGILLKDTVIGPNFQGFYFKNKRGGSHGQIVMYQKDEKDFYDLYNKIDTNIKAN